MAETTHLKFSTINRKENSKLITVSKKINNDFLMIKKANHYYINIENKLKVCFKINNTGKQIYSRNIHKCIYIYI